MCIRDRDCLRSYVFGSQRTGLAIKSRSMMNRLSSLHRLLISALIAGSLLFALADVVSAQQPFGNFEEYEANLLERPDLRRKIERQVAYPEGLTALWQRALERNDEQLSRLVIDSIAIAERRGVPGIGSMRETLIGLASDESLDACLLYTSPSPRDRTRSRMPSSA